MSLLGKQHFDFGTIKEKVGDYDGRREKAATNETVLSGSAASQQ